MHNHVVQGRHVDSPARQRRSLTYDKAWDQVRAAPKVLVECLCTASPMRHVVKQLPVSIILSLWLSISTLSSVTWWRTMTTLQKEIVTQGDGSSYPRDGSTVAVVYIGWLYRATSALQRGRRYKKLPAERNSKT